MGRYDSTRTRVTPVFDALLAQDPTGQRWLPRLLALPHLDGHAGPATLPPSAPLRDHAWGKAERGLKPPRSLLRWLVVNDNLPEDGGSPKTSEETRRKRAALARRDPDVIAEALALLDQLALPPRAWYVLEGASRPDVYLETEHAIIVIEGKRTERTATGTTTWMPNRSQMLRHLDCAWEIRGDRQVFGFFIIEGSHTAQSLTVPPPWMGMAQHTIAPETRDGSLRHRPTEERQAIAACFLGVTTWQRVCAEFGIAWAGMEDR